MGASTGPESCRSAGLRRDGWENTIAARQAASSVAHGEVHLVRRIAGFKKIRYYTHENVGYGNIDLPDQEMHTTAVWWQVNPDVLFAPAGW